MSLKTARLVLRPMVMADAPSLFAILGDTETMAFWDRPPLPRLATVEAQMADELAAVAAGSFFAWTVVKDRDAIGSIDLNPVSRDEAWIGFAFRRDQWGQGLAREAVTAIIAEAFGPMALSRMVARVQDGNQRALRLLQRLGFQQSGTLADVVREGERRACLRFTLTASRTANG